MAALGADVLAADLKICHGDFALEDLARHPSGDPISGFFELATEPTGDEDAPIHTRRTLRTADSLALGEQVRHGAEVWQVADIEKIEGAGIYLLRRIAADLSDYLVGEDGALLLDADGRAIRIDS